MTMTQLRRKEIGDGEGRSKHEPSLEVKEKVSRRVRELARFWL
jgi:hypothetical protein